jgi:ribosomal-protein-alanine N-acetyltransferase
MRPPEPIETDRLLLRRPRPSDLDAVHYGYATDPDVTRYLTFRPTQALAETRAFLENAIASWSGEKSFTYAITLRPDDRLVGTIALRLGDYNAELGYVLGRDYWGQGIMPEAAQPLVDWALAQPTIWRVWAICDVENIGSARVMEKVGMQREGLLRRRIMHPNVSDEPRDVLIYSIVK